MQVVVSKTAVVDSSIMHDNQHRPRAIVLWSIAAGYAFLNSVAVLLAANGIVHPPWNILLFFTWVGPAALMLALLVFQFSAQTRFGWPAAIGFLLALGFSMLINGYIYGRALAAV